MPSEEQFNEDVRKAREQVRRAQEQTRAAREEWRRWRSEAQAEGARAAQENWRRAGEELRRSFEALDNAWKSFETGWGRAPGKEAGAQKDFARIAGERLRDWVEPAPASAEKERLRLERERLREERRRRKQADGQADLIATGIGLAAGGLASLAAPLVAAVGAGLIAGGAAGVLLRWLTARHLQPAALPKPQATIAAPAVNAEGLHDSRLETVRTVLEHAAEHLREAQAAAASLTDPDAKALLDRLAATGQQIIQRVAARPELLPRAQRVLTYHVERASYVAETLAAMLRSSAAKPAQIEAAKHVLARMDNLFERTALELSTGDAREMDLEMRLIDQALDEDLRP